MGIFTNVGFAESENAEKYAFSISLFCRKMSAEKQYRTPYREGVAVLTGVFHMPCG
jgi:hypothetical protein